MAYIQSVVDDPTLDHNQSSVRFSYDVRGRALGENAMRLQKCLTFRARLVQMCAEGHLFEYCIAVQLDRMATFRCTFELHRQKEYFAAKFLIKQLLIKWVTGFLLTRISFMALGEHV